jgi:hypothetical protein
MTDDLQLQIAKNRSVTRQRMADRLGYILAKRWVRLHQKPELGRDDQRSKPDEGKQK